MKFHLAHHASAAAFFAIVGAMPAFSVSIDGIRGEMVKAVEKRGAELCQLTGYDVADDRVYPQADAERNYYRKVAWQGREREMLVGHWSRGKVKMNDRWTIAYRHFFTWQGHSLGEVIDGGLEYVSYTTPKGGTVMNLNSYYTVDGLGHQILDYNGQCDGDSFYALQQKNLYPALIKCLTKVWADDVAANFCQVNSRTFR